MGVCHGGVIASFDFPVPVAPMTTTTLLVFPPFARMGPIGNDGVYMDESGSGRCMCIRKWGITWFIVNCNIFWLCVCFYESRRIVFDN